MRLRLFPAARCTGNIQISTIKHVIRFWDEACFQVIPGSKQGGYPGIQGCYFLCPVVLAKSSGVFFCFLMNLMFTFMFRELVIELIGV